MYAFLLMPFTSVKHVEMYGGVVCLHCRVNIPYIHVVSLHVTSSIMWHSRFIKLLLFDTLIFCYNNGKKEKTIRISRHMLEKKKCQ